MLVDAGGALDSEEDGEMVLTKELGIHGAIDSMHLEEGRWRVRFASHAAAEAATAAASSGALPRGATALFPFYNVRPYHGRGWVRARAAGRRARPAQGACLPDTKALSAPNLLPNSHLPNSQRAQSAHNSAALSLCAPL